MQKFKDITQGPAIPSFDLYFSQNFLDATERKEMSIPQDQTIALFLASARQLARRLKRPKEEFADISLFSSDGDEGKIAGMRIQATERLVHEVQATIDEISMRNMNCIAFKHRQPAAHEKHHDLH